MGDGFERIDVEIADCLYLFKFATVSKNMATIYQHRGELVLLVLAT